MPRGTRRAEEALSPSDREALQDAFRKHYGSLERFCVLLSGGDEGEDLAQEAFVKASMHLVTVPPEARFSYLRRTALNLWKNGLRRRVAERMPRPSWAQAPDHIVDALDERDRMWQRIAKLPRKQRAVIVLRYYEDMAEQGIADVLGCSIGTVKSQLNRALAKLRKEPWDEP